MNGRSNGSTCMTFGMKKRTNLTVPIGAGNTTIEDLIAIACEGARVRLNPNEEWRENIREGARCVERLWRSDKAVYGVNTGYGESCERPVPHELVEELPIALVRFHG